MEPVWGGLPWVPRAEVSPKVLRAEVSMRIPVSAACSGAGHVLEAVADFGCCSAWQVHSHPLSSRVSPPYAGVTSVFGDKRTMMYPCLGGCEPSPCLQPPLGAEYLPPLSSPRHPGAALIALAATSDGNAVTKLDITAGSRAWGLQGSGASRGP